MKSIYQEKRWYQVQAVKEQGKLEEYELKYSGMKLKYNYVKRKAGIVNEQEYYDILTARGFGGPYVQCKDRSNIQSFISKFNQEFERFCIDNNIIAEYIKFDPWDNIIEELSSIYKIEPHGKLFCNNIQMDFFNEQYTYRARRSIRKAIKNGVSVEFDFKGDTISSFLEIYAYTKKKYKVSDYYNFDYDFIKRYFEFLKGNVCILNAIYHNQIISSALFVWGEDICHYHISGNNPEYLDFQGNSLLIYEASRFAQKLGKKIFDMGGSVSGSTVEDFKKGFVKDKNDIKIYYTGKKIRNKNIYQELIRQKGKNQSGYFPEYR